MLRQLRLKNFRSFRDFTISFSDGAILVGPNNAGKSTILTALRTADVLLRYAQQRNPTLHSIHGGLHYVAYPISLPDFPALLESVRYDFRGEEASFQLTWKSDARLTAVWPAVGNSDEQDPFFYIEKKPGMQVRNVATARSSFSGLGVIPILGPTEHSEQLLNDGYVRRNVSGRLSSRHFRNQLRLLRENGTYDQFIEYVSPWLEGLRFESFSQHMTKDGQVLDVFYREKGSTVPKELVWAGDGVQVWLQLLYHIYRVQNFDTIILDEPEVYLHPDLQRRLVHVLENTSRQVILATHSSEVITEANPKLVTLVEKTRKRASRAKDDSELQLMSSALGTAFNLRLAKALRSEVALFVEGKDMTIIGRFSKTLGFERLANEQGVTVIPLEGYSRWGEVVPFAWLTRRFLYDSIGIFVIMDRDYRPDGVIDHVEGELARENIPAHIWRRKELESYLLSTEVIARLAAAPAARVEEIINSVTAAMERDVFSRMLAERVRAEVTGKRHEVTVTADFKDEFDELWKSSKFRLEFSPAKRVLNGINSKLTEARFRPVSAHNLATAHRIEEIPPEMAGTLRRVEELIDDRMKG